MSRAEFLTYLYLVRGWQKKEAIMMDPGASGFGEATAVSATRSVIDLVSLLTISEFDAKC